MNVLLIFVSRFIELKLKEQKQRKQFINYLN